MASSAEKLMKQMQKMANDTQIKLQQLSNAATEKSFKYNAEEANTARTWQKEMSDTAHQREVLDLKKAGLNPVLAANQGAQSYTTSSASAQAYDPSGAVGSVANSLINARTGLYQADTSARAQRAAASQAAAAQRYAAQQAASAQRYAAYMNYQSSKYKADKDYKIQMEKPQGNPIAVADKYLGQYLSKGQIKDTVKIGKSFSEKDFSNKGVAKKDNFILNRDGAKKANQGLLSLGLPQTKNNRELYVKAYVFNSENASLKLSKLIATYKKAAKNVSNKKSLYW